MAEDHFCIACGAMLPEGSTFCPYCGHGPDEAPRSSPRVSEDDSRLDTIRVLVLIYGIGALLLGLLMLAMGAMFSPDFVDSLISQIETTDPQTAQTLRDLNVAWLQSTIYMSGAVTIASGALALVSSMLVKKRANRTMAVVLCVLAAIASVIYYPLCIVTIPVGLYMAYRIHSSPARFSRRYG